MAWQISTDEFIRIWNASDNLDAVSEKTGYSRAYCSLRAARLRRDVGVQLPKFRRGPARKVGPDKKHRSNVP